MKEGYNMEKLTTIAIDITRSVFENDKHSILYITKDIYGDCYILAIPSEGFSSLVFFNRIDKDLDYCLKFVNFRNEGQREKLVAVIKEGIESF